MRAVLVAVLSAALIGSASAGMAACDEENSNSQSHIQSSVESATSTESQEESSVTDEGTEESAEVIPPSQEEETGEEPETSAPSQEGDSDREEHDQVRPAIEGLQIKNAKGQVVNAINGFTELEYTFFAEPTNQGAETAYTATLSAGTQNAILTANADGTITFKATEAGEYVIHFLSGAKDTNGEDVTADLKLNLTPFSLIDGFFDESLTYTDGESTVTVDYAEDWEVGKFYIFNFPVGSYEDERYVDVVLDYAYDAITGELKTTLNESETSEEYFLYGEWEIARSDVKLGVCTVLPYIRFNDSLTALILGAVHHYDYIDGNGYTDVELDYGACDLYVKTEGT